MKRRHRLRGRSRFAVLRNSGIDVRQGRLRVRAAPNGLQHARVGIAVVRAHTAVSRNRLRRRLRAAMRPRLASWNGYDLLVSAPGDWEERPFSQLTAELDQAWIRAKRQTMDPSP